MKRQKAKNPVKKNMDKFTRPQRHEDKSKVRRKPKHKGQWLKDKLDR